MWGEVEVEVVEWLEEDNLRINPVLELDRGIVFFFLRNSDIVQVEVVRRERGRETGGSKMVRLS